MGSVSARFVNFRHESTKSFWVVEPPFARIKTDALDSVSASVVPDKPKSKRGRKKKDKKPKKAFPSNMSFFIYKDIHLPNPNAKTTPCKQHVECFVMQKKYNIRIFNGGQIICVGVLREDKSDFLECMEHVCRYLVRHDVAMLLPLNLPEAFYQKYAAACREKYKLVYLDTTLENYQFNIGTCIDLLKLRDYFIDSENRIINIDETRMLNFITEQVFHGIFEVNAVTLISLFSVKNGIKKHFIIKEAFLKVLDNWSLSELKQQFDTHYTEFYKTYSHKTVYWDKFKYNLLRNYVIVSYRKYYDELYIMDFSLVEGVRYKEEKSTLIVTKKKDDCKITVRIFGTGVINIQGANNRVTAEKIWTEYKKIFSLIAVTYNRNQPPMLKLESILI